MRFDTKDNNRLQITLASFGVAAPLIFWGIITVLGWLDPSYSHFAQTVSELGANGAPNAVYQNANFIVTGMLVIGFAIGLHRGISIGKGSLWGPVLVGIFGGAALVASGLLPCDLGCEGDTMADQLHFIGSTIGFPSMIAALFVLPRRMKQNSQWRNYATYTSLTGWVALLFAITLSFSFSGTVTALEPLLGLIQRIFTLNFFIWIFLTGIRLLRLTRRSGA